MPKPAARALQIALAIGLSTIVAAPALGGYRGGWAGPSLRAQGQAGWVRLSPSRLARAEANAATVGNAIYVVGGLVGPVTTNQVERYDPTRDRWEISKPMPVALNHAVVVSHGGDLYVLGGYTNAVFSAGVPTGGLLDASDLFLRYDPAQNSWSRMPRMPVGRAAAAAAVIGDKLYLAGGRDRLPPYLTSAGLLKRLDIFDFRTGVWTRGADMKIAREHVAGATVGGAFYAIGGRLAFDAPEIATNKVERYLPAQKRWEFAPSMAVAHNGFPAVTVGGRIVVSGSEEPSTPQLLLDNADSEIFDPATGSWSALPSMPTPRGAHAGAAVGQRVYAIEGIAPQPTTSCCFGSNVVEALDIAAAPAVAPALTLSVTPRRARVATRVRFRFHVTTLSGGAPASVRRAVIRFAGASARTDRRGRASIVARFRKPGRYRATASKRGLRSAHASVTILR